MHAPGKHRHEDAAGIDVLNGGHGEHAADPIIGAYVSGRHAIHMDNDSKKPTSQSRVMDVLINGITTGTTVT